MRQRKSTLAALFLGATLLGAAGTAGAWWWPGGWGPWGGPWSGPWGGYPYHAYPHYGAYPRYPAAPYAGVYPVMPYGGYYNPHAFPPVQPPPSDREQEK